MASEQVHSALARAMKIVWDMLGPLNEKVRRGPPASNGLRHRDRDGSDGVARELRPKTPPAKVSCNETAIEVRQPDGRVQAITWIDLGTVNLTASPSGTEKFDLVWSLACRGGRLPPISFSMEADGEDEFVRTMQSRLTGFDNMTVIEALSTAESASFVVWDHKGDTGA